MWVGEVDRSQKEKNMGGIYLKFDYVTGRSQVLFKELGCKKYISILFDAIDI